MAARGGILLVRAYKALFSQYFRGSCRFTPSCANYAALALHEHGFFSGVRLTILRLARCHPFCEAGYDPVPPRAPAAGGTSRARD